MEFSPFLFGAYKLAKYAIYPFTWLFLLIGMQLILMIWPAFPGRQRWIRDFGLVAFFLVFVLGNPMVAGTLNGFLESRYPSFDSSTTRQFDAVAVLGGGVGGRGSLRPSDQLSPLSLQRTVCGADLFTQGVAPRIIFSGGDASVFGQGPVEAMEMKRLALRLGVPEEAILLEGQSRNTYEQAVGTRQLLGEASVVVVTSASHIPRAVGLFRKQGLDATAYPCGYRSKDLPFDLSGVNPFDLLPTVGALRTSTAAIHEIVGYVVYWVVRAL